MNYTTTLGWYTMLNPHPPVNPTGITSMWDALFISVKQCNYESLRKTLICGMSTNIVLATLYSIVLATSGLHTPGAWTLEIFQLSLTLLCLDCPFLPASQFHPHEWKRVKFLLAISEYELYHALSCKTFFELHRDKYNINIISNYCVSPWVMGMK